MNSLEKGYLDNVERANARDRRRELFIAFLTSRFMPMSEVALEQSMDGRLRSRIRVVLVVLAVVATGVLVSYGSGTPKEREDAYCRLFVFAFAGVITAGKYLYGRFRRWNNARLEREWERRLGLDSKETP